ncbi:MAG: GNAT family N-acetyltransferase [Bacteroidales bacterium]|nr:GNAT family N-acetyltransferase [Bacteroidales bacterium]
MIIRQANIRDVGKLSSLTNDFRKFYNSNEKPDSEIQNYLEQRIRNNDSIIFIVEIDKIFVAYAQLFPSYSTIGLFPVYILNDLFVLKDFRYQGIAEKLLDKVISFALETERKQIWLLTENENLKAQNLYLKKGFIKTKFQHYAYKL